MLPLYKSQLENIYQEMLRKLQERLDLSQSYQDEEINDIIYELIRRDLHIHLSLEEKERLRIALFNRLRGFDILSILLEDSTITEVMINGPQAIFVERNGVLEKTDYQFESKERLIEIIMKIASNCNKSANESDPIVDARLEDGSRVNIVMPPVALNGPILTIRKFPERPYDMEEMVEFGSISQEASKFLKWAVIHQYSIFISGGTSTGKTTFINALSRFIPANERIITIEDNAELMLQGIPNLVGLEVREGNREGGIEVSMKDLIKSALRMRPNRIIVGEVRGEEVIDLLAAMNTGHPGSMSTGHSNSPKELVSRLALMFLRGMDIPLHAIEGQIASSIDLIIQLKRLTDGRRIVSEITEIVYENENIIFNPIFQRIEGCLMRVGELIVMKEEG